MNFICFNGLFKKEDEPVLTVNNRAYKWGDGVFETIKVFNGEILLQSLHFERLFLSLQLLKINIDENFTAELLAGKILELCYLNKCTNSARVRLEIYRNETGFASYSIEAIALAQENKWLEEGIKLDVYPYGRKSCDAFANLKTTNFLIYVLAKLYADEKGFDDCIVLNSDNKIADTTKANFFIIKDETFYTPALNQGCVNGVMRRFVIEQIKALNYIVHQKEITENDVLNADEVFITNAIIGMQWIKSFRQKEFKNTLSAEVYKKISKIIN